MRIKFLHFITILCFILMYSDGLFAQKTRWPYMVEGSDNGRGVPKVWSYGYNSNAITPYKDRKEGKTIKPGKKPTVLHFQYEKFEACQVVVTETYNPGAITKVIIGYKPKGKGKTVKKTVWEGAAQATAQKYTVKYFHFDMTPNVTDVWVYVDYAAIEGVNQYGGVCLSNSSKNYYPKVNVPKSKIFAENVKKLNDDINGEKNPSGLILSADNKYLYFSHMEKNREQIYRAELNDENQIVKVIPSDFNLPRSKSKTCGLIGISQDNNIGYVSDMKLSRFEFYKTYVGKSIFGNPKWKYEKEKIKKYNNGGIFLDYVMSYDGNVVILGYKEKSDLGDRYKEDLYVSIKDERGNWTPFKHMGFDINSLGTETPCYLAPDNKTLYYSSSGRIGFGQGDIYVTKRLDDTWTNWSEPLNLGNSINSGEHENSFVLDGQSGRMYFIRWEDDEHTNIYTSELYIEPPKPVELPPLEIPSTDSIPQQDTVTLTQVVPPPVPEPVLEEQIMPEPVIIVNGVTTNKKTNEVIQAEIKYYDIYNGQVIGNAISNAATGEYSIILRKGIYYAFDANAPNFIGESHSLNTTELKDFGKIRQDFALTPIEKNATVRLNNIFFETDKSELLPASFTELDKLIVMLNQNIKIKIEIGGHTDNIGSDSYNQKLSERRANAVKDYLISKGINADRIVAKGYGESKPVVENNSPENNALNRRVEFTILETGN